jgi:cell division septum initiation protein DivIVA
VLRERHRNEEPWDAFCRRVRLREIDVGHLSEDEQLERAKAVIGSMILAAPTTRFADAMYVLSSLLGRYSPGPVIRENVSRRDVGGVEISNETRAAIAASTTVDRALYEWVSARFDQLWPPAFFQGARAAREAADRLSEVLERERRRASFVSTPGTTAPGEGHDVPGSAREAAPSPAQIRADRREFERNAVGWRAYRLMAMVDDAQEEIAREKRAHAETSARLLREVEAREADIRQLEHAHDAATAERDEAARSHREHLAALGVDRERIEQRYSEELAALRAGLEMRVARLERELAWMRGSLSWKLTGPLRAVKEALR